MGKYFQLTLYFSTVPATASMLAAAFVGAAFDVATRTSPKLTFTNGDPMYTSPVVLGVSVYYVVLIFAADIATLFCLKRFVPKVFLDRLCINKADPTEKKYGVE